MRVIKTAAKVTLNWLLSPRAITRHLKKWVLQRLWLLYLNHFVHFCRPYFLQIQHKSFWSNMTKSYFVSFTAWAWCTTSSFVIQISDWFFEYLRVLLFLFRGPTLWTSVSVCQGIDFPDLAPKQVIQYVADNVDHTKITIDGRNMFHGMGMIAAIIPHIKTGYQIPRITVLTDDICSIRHVKIKYFTSAAEGIRSLSYQPLV